MFSGICAFVLPARLISSQRKIIINNLKEHGANVREHLEDHNLTHIFVDESVDIKLLRTAVGPNLDRLLSHGVIFLRVKWISSSVKANKLLPIEDFCLKLDQTPSTVPPVKPPELDSNANFNNNIPSSLPSPKPSTEPSSSIPNPFLPKKSSFACDHPSEASAPDKNLNKEITTELEILFDCYNTSQSPKDRWRARSYQLVIARLKRYPHKISSYEDLRKMPFVGERLARKIMEIVQTGSLQKSLELQQDPKLRTVKLFKSIWGVGPATAESWFSKGFRSLDDLRTKATLNSNQQVGLSLYEELSKRIPWEEADLIVNTVRSEVSSMDPDLVSIGCGSYRRKAKTCGDVDILIVLPDSIPASQNDSSRSESLVLAELVRRLTSTGFLTNHLSGGRDFNPEHHAAKYLGVCKLPGENLHRRIDLTAIPQCELATALVASTGSEHFVRSMNLKAKKMGFKLSAHELRKNVVRDGGGNVVCKGEVVKMGSEEEVFKVLGVPWRKPEERELP